MPDSVLFDWKAQRELSMLHQANVTVEEGSSPGGFRAKAQRSAILAAISTARGRAYVGGTESGHPRSDDEARTDSLDLFLRDAGRRPQLTASRWTDRAGISTRSAPGCTTCLERIAVGEGVSGSSPEEGFSASAPSSEAAPVPPAVPFRACASVTPASTPSCRRPRGRCGWRTRLRSGCSR